MAGEDGGPETFGVIGSVISVVACLGMVFILVSDAHSRSQMRARMLITLAVLDTLYSLFELGFLVNIADHSGFSLSNIGPGMAALTSCPDVFVPPL
jgi:hypothetical protein